MNISEMIARLEKIKAEHGNNAEIYIFSEYDGFLSKVKCSNLEVEKLSPNFIRVYLT